MKRKQRARGLVPTFSNLRPSLATLPGPFAGRSRRVLDRGVQMQGGQGEPLWTKICAGRKVGEGVGSCLVSGVDFYLSEGGKRKPGGGKSWSCPSRLDLGRPSLPLHSLLATWSSLEVPNH